MRQPRSFASFFSFLSGFTITGSFTASISGTSVMLSV